MAAKTKSNKQTKPPGSVRDFADAAECLKTLAHLAGLMNCIEGRFLTSSTKGR